jgi:hypothetical protein
MIRGMKGIGRKGDTRPTGRHVLQRRFGGSVAATFLAIATMMLLMLPAGALEQIVISTDTVVRGSEGEVHVLVEVPTGDEAGCEAQVSATAQNNPSVHVGNDLIVSSGGASVVISDVESAPGTVKSANGTLTLSDTLVVAVKLGPADEFRANSIFSGGVTVNVTCVPVETTTTTQPTTTTTVPLVSSTTVFEVTTTTTAPEETTTTTTPPPTVLGTSTTTLPSTTSVPPVSGSTLPFTGPEDLMGPAIAGGALLLLGLALMRAAREPQAND